MTDGNTLIVDVVSSGDGYMLNDTPVNMMIAYEVVRRHVTDNGTFYSQMTMKQKTAEGYVFKFDTGDVFESASDTAYPTAEAVSDESGGGSADNSFVVTLTPTSESGGTMDKSNAEILAAYMQGKRIMFDITVGSAACRVQATLSALFEGAQYPSFNAYGIDASGTTIINLYVDPSDEESYTFTMDAVEIGGGESDFVRVNVENVDSGSWTCEKTKDELLALKDAGKCILICKKIRGASTDFGILLFSGLMAFATNLTIEMSGPVLSVFQFSLNGSEMTISYANVTLKTE